MEQLENSAMTRGSGWQDLPPQKRNGHKGLLPSTWLGPEIRLEYRGAGGAAQHTTGTLLDVFPAGPVLNIFGARTIFSWDAIVVFELVED